jgi:hypothetical protein
MYAADGIFESNKYPGRFYRVNNTTGKTEWMKELMLQRMVEQNQQVLNQNQQVLENNRLIIKLLYEESESVPSESSSSEDSESVPSKISSSEDSEYVPSESSSSEDSESVPSKISSSEDSEYVPSETASTLTEYSTETEEEEEDDDFMTERSKQMCYSGEEIKKMNDFELVSNFVRIKGVTHLSCSHCKKPKPIVGTWVFAIRNRCERKGLSVNTPLPKTCDHMLLVDRVRNSVNNKIYPILRNSDVSAEDKQRAIDWKSKKFAEIGNKIRPSKYAESDN